MATIQEALTLAVEHHRAGRLAEAEGIYCRILAVRPDMPQVWHLLGVMAQQVGRHDVAVTCLDKALAGLPGVALLHALKGRALAALGHAVPAAEAYRRAADIEPGNAEHWFNQGEALRAAGRLALAAQSLREATARDPRHIAAHVELGKLLLAAGQADEAAGICRRGLEADAANVVLRTTLAQALRAVGDRREALAAYIRAERLDDTSPDLHASLGELYLEQGRVEEAIVAYARAIELKPDQPDFHAALGGGLIRAGCVGEAEAALTEALRLKPTHAEALAHLGQVRTLRGAAPAGAETLRKAVAAKPDDGAIHSRRLHALLHHPGHDETAILAEHQAWDARHGRPLFARAELHHNDRHPDRALKVGYVSPDLGQSPVGWCLRPVLPNHEPGRAVVHVYSDRVVEDELSADIKAGAAVWRRTAGLSDEDVAAMIRDDGIDILVDLAGHGPGNRLGVFARKPAPVQVSWLGYPATTGLSAMDYVLADEAMVPPGAERWFTEEVVRLPGGRLCWAPPNYAPDVAPPPALDRGFVTFGSFNSLAKVGPEVMKRWAAVLDAVPDSRLLLKWNTLCDGAERQRIAHLFSAEGIDSRRLDLRDASSHERLLSEYDDVDIALDPSPVGGGVTSCEALWMGVPVVTLPGARAASRQTVSLLNTLKMTGLGASSLDAVTPQDYVRIASKLAMDLPRLNSLRARLRTRMKASGLLDGERFAQRLEIAYREMWRRWCGRNR
ncbi:MAG TPA: tetratricopeptide repeat protein [Azospirillaceae bacterium]|nr:tetratricopeptide repeat protein [Azospirillaceae bacterium]